jgi:hypothetical protein
MKPMVAGNALTRIRIEDQGFSCRKMTAGVVAWVRDFNTDIEDCHFEIHLLPSFDGWIVEFWNWQGADCEVHQRVALPRLFQTAAELSSLLSLVGQ